MTLTKLSPLRRSIQGGDGLDNILNKEAVSLDGKTHKGVGEGEDLVKFGVDMTELSAYLDNIITVIN